MEPEDCIDADTAKRPRSIRVMVKVVIPVVIVLLALAVAEVQMNTRRRAQQETPARQAKSVDVIAAQRTDVQTIIHAMGTVVPAQTVALMPQVSGRVVSLNPCVVPGGLVRTDEALLQIDTRDYELTTQQCHQAVARARLDLALEQGNQAVARAEYDLLGDTIPEQDRDLVLRKPHLEEAEAAWQAAQATLVRAELDLDRCRITAPFNGIIQAKHVDLGATVSPSTALLTLIGTEDCWIEVTVRGEELEWIQIPSGTAAGGSSVRVFDKSQWGPGVHRQGGVMRLLPDLEPDGRMVRLLVRVPDPLALQSEDLPRLLMGAYVRVEITGRPLDSMIPVAREHLRNGDTVWIMNSESRLEIRSVEIVFRDKDRVYIRDGLESGESIVVTDIGTPVENMLLALTAFQSEERPCAENQEEKSL